MCMTNKTILTRVLLPILYPLLKCRSSEWVQFAYYLSLTRVDLDMWGCSLSVRVKLSAGVKIKL